MRSRPAPPDRPAVRRSPSNRPQPAPCMRAAERPSHDRGRRDRPLLRDPGSVKTRLFTSDSYDRAVRVGLVGCVKTKVNYAAPAQELYVSTLFRGRRLFVEATCDRWFILSAKHGLVAPDEVLEPYEETLNDNSVAAKRAWATSVLCLLESSVSIAGTAFEIHAGAEYRNFGLVNELRRYGATVEIPAAHLSQGEQLAFYSSSQSAGIDDRVSRSAESRSAPRAARGVVHPPCRAFA